MLRSLSSNSIHRSTAAILIGAALAAAPASAEIQFEIVGLGSLGESGSWANSINDAGQIVGRAHTSYLPVPDSPLQISNVHAFLFHGGALIDLGTLPGHAVSIAFDINTHGDVVGYSASGQPAAFVWADGAMTPLQAIPGFSSAAHAINDHGLIVGSVTLNGGGATDEFPVRWMNGLVAMLPFDAAWSSAFATNVNNTGHSVGMAHVTSSQEDHAVLWADGAAIDLGTLDGSPFSCANAINDAGAIIGHSGVADGGIWVSRAVRWDGGVIQDLGSLGGNSSDALDINAHGHIVGTADVGSTQHAFLWQDGHMIDLNDLIDPESGWVLGEAHAINDAGQIVGSGVRNGATQAFLLDPIVIECPRGDLTGDCFVNSFDLGQLLDAWTQSIDGEFNPAADLNGDGSINGFDLGILLSNWG